MNPIILFLYLMACQQQTQRDAQTSAQAQLSQQQQAQYNSQTAAQAQLYQTLIYIYKSQQANGGGHIGP